jgi:hypothetical protein
MEMYMRIAAISLLLATLCLGACDDTNDVIIVPIARTGTFILQTVNGQALPAVAVDSVSPPLRIEVLSGAITINANNTFADNATFRQTLGGTVTTRSVICAGTYTIVSNTLTFTESGPSPDCGRTFSGVLTGTTLTASILGATAVYIR